MGKHIGTILENRWKVIEVEYKKKATLQNIYNNEIYEICYSSFYKILQGKTTVSKIRSHKCGFGNRGYRYRKKTRDVIEW
jgi:hypothetical protein